MDALVGKYLPDEPATPAPSTPAAHPETPLADADIPAGEPDPDAVIGDTPGDLEGDVETGDEPGEGEPAEPPEEDEEVEALLAATAEEPAPKDTSKESFLPEFDRVKFLEQHPELEAPYKHMQAAFSKKMAEVAKTKANADSTVAEAEAMRTDLLAFQETLRNDESFEDFLVQVSLNRPEVMERAYERAVALNEDEGKKKEYLQGQELAETKRKLQEREQRDAAAKLQTRTAEIIDLTRRVASKLGLVGEGDLEVAEQYVATQILQNVANGGERDISNEQLVGAIRRAAKALALEKEQVVRTTRATARRENLKAAQDRVRNPRRPAPPRPGTPAPAPATNRVDYRPKQAPLDSWIDAQIGVEP